MPLDNLNQPSEISEVRCLTDCPYPPGILTFEPTVNGAIASSVTDATRLWYKEAKLFDTKSTNNAYTNFTQIIWRNTKQVGCAIAQCGPGTLDPHNVRTLSPTFVSQPDLRLPYRPSLSLRAFIAHLAIFPADSPTKSTNSNRFLFFHLKCSCSVVGLKARHSVVRVHPHCASERFFCHVFQVYLRLFSPVRSYFTILTICPLHLCSPRKPTHVDTRCSQKSRVSSLFAFSFCALSSQLFAHSRPLIYSSHDLPARHFWGIHPVSGSPIPAPVATVTTCGPLSISGIGFLRFSHFIKLLCPWLGEGRIATVFSENV